MARGPVDVVHVAQAGENRGRVVLRLASADPDRFAIAAALRLANAYEAELESIFIEDQQLLDICAHPQAREISLCGRESRGLSPVTLMRQFAYAARQAERRVAAMAHAAEITYRARTMRDDPMHALNRACAETGPWNVVALADAVRPGDGDIIQRLLVEMTGATGLMFVCAGVRRVDGPVLVVVEDIARLPLMLRVAERMAADATTPVVLAAAPRSETEGAAMDEHIRLLLGARLDVHVVSFARTRGHTGALVEAIRRLGPGFLIGEAGGVLLPMDNRMADVARVLDCPLLVMR